jgi:hypothetical protein
MPPPPTLQSFKPIHAEVKMNAAQAKCDTLCNNCIIMRQNLILYANDHVRLYGKM